jgi:tetratricopeptide (TPR) repeat protein
LNWNQGLKHKILGNLFAFYRGSLSQHDIEEASSKYLSRSYDGQTKSIKQPDISAIESGKYKKGRFPLRRKRFISLLRTLGEICTLDYTILDTMLWLSDLVPTFSQEEVKSYFPETTYFKRSDYEYTAHIQELVVDTSLSLSSEEMLQVLGERAVTKQKTNILQLESSPMHQGQIYPVFEETSKTTKEEDIALYYQKKYQLRLLSTRFFEEIKKIPASALEFYAFTEPSWSDIVNDFDVIRSDHETIINELEEYENRLIFLPILAPSCEGKSTFLRRLAYELFLKGKSVLFLETDPRFWNINTEQLAVDLQELCKSLGTDLYLLIDDCFQCDVEFLLLSTANKLIPLKIVGTSQTREYKKSVERNRATVIRKGRPFHLSNLRKHEITGLVAKFQNFGIIEITDDQVHEAINDTYKTKGQFVELISRLLPRNRFDARVRLFLDTVQTNKIIYSSYCYISLVCQFGLIMPLSLVTKLIYEKHGLVVNEADILQEITRLAKGEIHISTIEDVVYIHLRHRRWAIESVKVLFPHSEVATSDYERIINLSDETSLAERKLTVNLLLGLIKFQNVKTARKIYFSEAFQAKLGSMQRQISAQDYIDNWLPLKLNFRGANQEDLSLLDEVLMKSLQQNPIDQELYFKQKYLQFLKDDSQNSTATIITKFLDNSSLNYSSIKYDSGISHESILQGLSLFPRSDILAYAFIENLSLMGKYDEIRTIFDNFVFTTSALFIFKKAAFYFENEEYEKAWTILQTSLTKESMHLGRLWRNYYQPLLYCDYDMALQQIEIIERKDSNWASAQQRQAFYLKAELYLIYSKKEEMQVLWEKHKQKRSPCLMYLWYIVSMTFLGKYPNPQLMLAKLLVNPIFKTESYSGINAEYFVNALYHLAKLFYQNHRFWADSYTCLQLARELAIHRHLYTIRIDNLINRLNNTLIESTTDIRNSHEMIMRIIMITRRFQSIIPSAIRFEILSNLQVLYQTLLTQEKINFHTYFEYALTLVQFGKKIEARKFFQKAIELKPNNAELNNQFANFLKDELGEYDQAEIYYRQAIASSKKENMAKYRNNLAILFIDSMNVERFEEAKQLLDQARKAGFIYAVTNLQRLNDIRSSISTESKNINETCDSI